MKNINSNAVITINLAGGAEEQLKKDVYGEWISLKGKDVLIDDEKAAEYVSSLAEKYNTFKTERTFKTHNGETIKIGGSEKDTFGYRMDEEETTKRLIDAIKNGDKEIDARWPLAGNERTEDNDFGTTYVEVSIDEQHMWFYKDGEAVLDSDIVSGSPSHGGTTKGVFMVLNKESPSVLRGEGYATKVNWWMPFTYTGTGLHDASWRSKFGNEIYKKNGSHGCVNLPSDVAKELYEIIETGTPVIVQ